MDVAGNNMFFSPYDSAEKTPEEKFECWIERTYLSMKRTGRKITRVSILGWQVTAIMAKQYGIQDKMENVRVYLNRMDKAESTE